MKIIVALLLNALLLATLVWWLRREYRQAKPSLRRWLLPTLVVRVVAGVLPHGSDSDFALHWGQSLTAQFWAQPSATWALLQGHEIRGVRGVLNVYEWSNTLFTLKIVGLLSLASLSTEWLTCCYLSIGCFVGCWMLVRTLARVFPAIPAGAGVVAFLLWPSVIWWASGVTKEALVLGSGTAMGALVLNGLYNKETPKKWLRLVSWLLLFGLSWFHVRMRYFFALPLLGSLVALVCSAVAQRRNWLRAGWLPLALTMMTGVVAAGAIVVAVGGEPVSKAFVTSQLWKNYVHGLATSTGRPHLAYPGLQPTVSSMAIHFPLAAIQTLVRPWLGESALLRYVGAGFENLLIIALLSTAGVALVRGRPGRLPPALVLALLLYCIVLAGLIGLSTPNIGTLLRYRTIFLPWLLWLLLQNDYARQILRRLGLGD
jgi:hypothetical protein